MYPNRSSTVINFIDIVDHSFGTMDHTSGEYHNQWYMHEEIYVIYTILLCRNYDQALPCICVIGYSPEVWYLLKMATILLSWKVQRWVHPKQICSQTVVSVYRAGRVTASKMLARLCIDFWGNMKRCIRSVEEARGSKANEMQTIQLEESQWSKMKLYAILLRKCHKRDLLSRGI